MDSVSHFYQEKEMTSDELLLDEGLKTGSKIANLFLSDGLPEPLDKC